MSNTIVSAGKITLSRNISGTPFPSKLRDNRASVMAGSVYEAVSKTGNYELYRMGQIAPAVTQKLLEGGLISNRLVSGGAFGSAIVSDDKSVSIMINEEDHVVEQCFYKGDGLAACYDKINKIDDVIAAKQRFSYHGKLGYLTSSPENLGTGMHVSVTLFLPGITLTKSLSQLVGIAGRLGVTVRPVYEDSVGAYVYVLTNQKTLGVSEKEIIELMETAVSRVSEAEERARKMLKISSEAEIHDKACRSYAILKNAYKLSTTEMISLIAWAKIGVAFGWIDAECEKLDAAQSAMLPSQLTESSGMNFESALDRDVYRAEAIKSLI